MIRKIKILPEASFEFDVSANWYEKHSPRRGDLFTTAVMNVLDRALEQPELFPIVKGQVRQAKVPKYPFCVYFKSVDVGILVISVFHTSRNPELWQQRDS